MSTPSNDALPTAAATGRPEQGSAPSGGSAVRAATSVGAPPLRASAPFMLRHAAHFIALGFGSGLSPVAPGTAGTLWAWLAFLAIQVAFQPSDLQWALIIAATLLLGWWASTVTAQHLRVADPGQIVIDEIVAFWIVLWLLMPAGFFAQLAAFFLFRYFDAAKPGPVRWADGLFKGFGWRGGFGIVFDDLVAAFCTLLVIAAWRAW